jgi:protein TonB
MRIDESRVIDLNEVAQGKHGAIRARSYLSWAFIISIALHLTLGGLIRHTPQVRDEPPPEEIVLTTPAPRPTEPPPPTPPPKMTPPAVVASHPPPHALTVHPPPQTRLQGSGPSEMRYSPPPGGDRNGVASGLGDSTAPPTIETAAPTAAPTPLATPTRPACSSPHVDARTTQKAEADYPTLAQAQGAAGTATVKVALSATGSVTGTAIYKSSGYGALDQEALKAARNSRYSPEIEDCQKVPGQYLFVVEFSSQ